MMGITATLRRTPLGCAANLPIMSSLAALEEVVTDDQRWPAGVAVQGDPP